MQEDVNINDIINCKLIKKNNFYYFSPENEFGNVEYKYKLINPSKKRIHHLSTQMKWRLQEGNGVAFYKIGVEDNGRALGLTESEMCASINSLICIAKNINATIQLNEQIVFSNKTQEKEAVRKIANVWVQNIPKNQNLIEIRLAILGSAEVGKSTLCGVLTQGVLDNGQGMTRLNVFRHLHEFKSGKTSSICLEFLGFNSQNKILNYKDYTLEELIQYSTKIVTLIDLAGDRRYLKTTIYGVCGYNPHYCAILINGVTGITKMTKEHIGLAWALRIPFFAIITKVDLMNKYNFAKVLFNIECLIKSLNDSLKAIQIEKEEDIKLCESLSEGHNSIQKIVPIFSISNVTGIGLNLLTQFFALLPQYNLQQLKNNEVLNNTIVNNKKTTTLLFYIDEVFQLKKIGTVVCGLLANGTIRETDEIQIGPNKTGDYLKGIVKSIQKNKQPVLKVFTGERASIHITILKDLNKPNINSLNQKNYLRKGMVVISSKDIGVCYRKFLAKFYLLYHSPKQNKISVGFQGTVNIGSLCRRITITKIENLEFISLNEWVTVTFKFINQVEYLQVGMQLIFREGTTRGMGEVIEIYE